MGGILVNHPNILTIFEVGQHEGIYFIASELVNGNTLRQKLQDPLTPSAVVDIAIQATAGLKAANDAGTVHRGVKPENITIREDGLVKIVDFGLARVAERHTAFARMRTGQAGSDTRPGLVLGTSQYMSPEQARGIAVDARADIFSLGAVMYEIVRGKPAFEGKTDSDRIAAILLTEPRPLCETTPGAPSELARIIGRAMSKDVETRYQSAAELLAELQAVRQAYLLSASNVIGKPRAARATRVEFAAVALLCVLSILFFAVRRRKDVIAPAAGRPISLAILPFRNLRQDPDSDFLGSP